MNASVKSGVRLLALTALVLGTSSSLLAQDPPGGRPSSERSYALRIGPANSLDRAVRVRGRISLLATPSDDTREKVVSVEFAVDGKLVGVCPKRPFQVQCDTTALGDGSHTVKAVGRDNAGKEVWSASARIDVSNSARGNELRERGLRPSSDRTLLFDRAEAAVRKRARTDQSRRTQQAPGTLNRDSSSRRTGQSAPLRALPNGIILDQEYSNSYQGFSIKYPRGWTFEDQTAAMRAKSEEEFWIQFGTYPIEKSAIIVNIRRVKLVPGTDAEGFARQNAYVKTWEQKTVLGKPAFTCTSRVLASRPAVVHRLILVDGGFAWMMNCTDYTAKSPEASLSLFENMVASLKISGTQTPARKP